MTQEKLRLSYSKINTWQTCHLKYKYCYIDRLVRKEEKSYPLQVGDVVHRLMHLWYTGELTARVVTNLEKLVQKLYPGNEDPTTLSVAADAAALMKGYLDKFSQNDPIKFISTEVHLQVELPNYFLYGIIDALGRPEDKRLWRVEHKTTSRMDSFYLNGLKGGLQGAIYDYLIEQVMKEEVKGTIYNILVKTKIPQYERVYTNKNRAAVKRMLETVDGVYREIARAEYFPSSRCFSYNTDCDYKLLCDNDNEVTRQSFYKTREEGGDEK